MTPKRFLLWVAAAWCLMVVLGAALVLGDSPALKPGSRVTLTLADGSTATARVFLGVDGPALLFPYGAEVVGWTLTPFGDPAPGPTPPPVPPDPVPPAPIPVTSVAWLIVVDCDNAADRTIGQNKVLTDPSVPGALKASGIKYRRYAASDPDVAKQGYDKAIGSIKPPAILLLDKSGAVVKSAAVPNTTAELLSMVKGGTR